MTKTAEALDRQQQRARKRRDQVLAAAEICFRREGFHAASVSRIAAEAGMSAGHLYRYFGSKEDIILALCDRRFQDYVDHSPLERGWGQSGGEAVVDAALEDFDWLVDEVQARYVMDVFAEAGRSEAIASIVADHDRRLRDGARALLRRHFARESPEEVERRVEMMILILEGLMMRTVGNRNADKGSLRDAFAHLMRAVFRPGASRSGAD